jgi:4-amino-4-deoxy-L-arabinose transferase-like glycosyltransferase
MLPKQGIKSKQKNQKRRLPSEIPDIKSIALAGISRYEVGLKYILHGLFFIYLLYYLFQLYSSLETTFFWADENKHAYISALILKNLQIPTILPEEIYGGFKWSYPPLFHVLNAGVIGAVGISALKYTNLFLLLIFLLFFYTVLLKQYGQNVALSASLLITLSPVLAINTVRFTTEMLSMLLIFSSVSFLLLSLKKTKINFAIVSGLSTGFLMLSKQVGTIVLSFYILLFIWFLWKNKQNSKIMFYIIGVALGVYLPYIFWALYHKVDVLNFVSLFFGNKPELVTEAVKSFRRYDSSFKEFAYLFYSGNGLAITISSILPLYYFVRNRFKDSPQNYIFLLSIHMSAVMILWHITNARHTITILPLTTFLFGYSLLQTVGNKIAQKAIILLLFFLAVYSTNSMPNYRQIKNAPQEFLRLAQKLEKESSNDRILYIQTFDLFMYTGKPVIWPNPNLDHIPLDLFEKQNHMALYDLLKKYQIGYIMIDSSFISTNDSYYGRNYPIIFLRNCEILDSKGKIILEAITKSKRYILLKVL